MPTLSKTKTSFIILLLTLSLFSFFFLTHPAIAQDCSSGLVPCGRSCDNPETTTVNEMKPCTLCHFIIGFWNLINYGFRIMVFVALVALVGAGILYITSAGNEQMMTTAKTFLKDILMGFGIILLAWVIIFSVMRYILVKPSLGIEKAGGWTKFECSTDSVPFQSPPNGSDIDGGGDEDINGETNHLVANRSSINFGNAASTQTITFSNGGTLPLTGSLITISGSGFARVSGAMSDTCADGMTLNPGDSCTVSVTYSPQTGATNGTVTMTAGGKTTTVNLTGAGTGGGDEDEDGDQAENLTANPSSTDFGNVSVNTTNQAIITLRNTGTQNTKINLISTDAPFHWLYSNSANTCANNQVLSPNASCKIALSFAPTSSGSFSGTVTVSYGTSGLLSLDLKGNGGSGGGDGETGQPDLDLSNFSGVTSSFNAGDDESFSVTITNQGTASTASKNTCANKQIAVSAYQQGAVQVTEYINDLAVGAQQKVVLNFRADQGCGIHSYCTFSIKVDPDNCVTESSETNNTTARQSLRTR